LKTPKYEHTENCTWRIFSLWFKICNNGVYTKKSRWYWFSWSANQHRWTINFKFFY